jgi:putative membrane protein
MTEANSMDEPDKGVLLKHYKILSRKLWILITWPSAGFAIIFGLGIMHPYFSTVWFWIKIGLVIVLLIYHHLIHFAYKNLQKDNFKYSVSSLNTWFETVIVLLLAIVFVAVMKNSIYIYLKISAGIALAVLTFLAIRAIIRKRNKKKSANSD